MTIALQIQSDYAYCERIIRKHSKSFYFAFSKLPKQKAQAVYAVYAFCRIADDSVDEHTSPSEQLLALNTLEKELELFEQGKEISHPLWRALRDVFQWFDMDIQPFYDQLAGQRMDINFSIPKTLDDLEHYSKLVAGSVGLMLQPIIASKVREDLTEVSLNLGIAMQITNVLRDIGEDLRDKDRIYLPLEEMAKANYTMTDFLNGHITPEFIQLWEKLAARAEALYDTFQMHIDQFDADSQQPVAASAHIYREILNAVRKNDYDCFTKRSFVQKHKMINIRECLNA
ncbi:phytoene/squalene synthase family protein [Lentibacillus saliphilus]|uniref:phytoene/squalene synthase family protein n=1 Tax=Lentibacillus saliphilus TaxID=2737028 RepID=UPI001C2F79E9|nr:phytoene/squalene synthase family protein [Lentibacillus saliphilus]